METQAALHMMKLFFRSEQHICFYLIYLASILHLYHMKKYVNYY